MASYKSMFPPKGIEAKRAAFPGEEAIKKGEGPGPIEIPMPGPETLKKYPGIVNALDWADYLFGWLVPFNEKRKEKPKLEKPPEEDGKKGFSKGDYRDFDTVDTEFGYARLKREAKRRGYNVVELPDLRMHSTFGNIGYEKDGDLYVAMSKAGTREGTEILAHELMAAELQRKTGNYNHEEFHPVIEPVQGRAARKILSGRDAKLTVDNYVDEALAA